jgi:hypothetical protein
MGSTFCVCDALSPGKLSGILQLAQGHSLPYETIVDLEGSLVAAPSPVTSCTQSAVEIHVTKAR